MQRHIHADLFIGGNTLENRCAEPVVCTDAFGKNEAGHVRNLPSRTISRMEAMEFFLAESVENFVVIKFDRGSSNLTTVDDARKLFRTAKAAARTRTLRLYV